MTNTWTANLEDRGVVAVTGTDSGKLLHGLVTNDLALLGQSAAIHTALLTPQGKIIADFFVVKADDGYRLESRATRRRRLPSASASTSSGPMSRSGT